QARASSYLNPGNGWVSRLCHEPRVGLAALLEMLAPFVGAQRVRVLLRHKAIGAAQANDCVSAIRVRSLETENGLVLNAPYFGDATELGDLLPMTGTEYVTGSESQKETGEPHAAEQANPSNHQAFTCCFAIDHLIGENHIIDKPEEYAFWRDYVPSI